MTDRDVLEAVLTVVAAAWAVQWVYVAARRVVRRVRVRAVLRRIADNDGRGCDA